MIATRVPSEADEGSVQNIQDDLHMIVALCDVMKAEAGVFPYRHKVGSIVKVAEEILYRCGKIEAEQERLRQDIVAALYGEPIRTVQNPGK